MPDFPEGAIIITPQEVYAKVMALTDRVTELVVRAEADDTKNVVDRLEARVRILEQFRWVITGVSLAGGGCAGALVSRIVGTG